MSHDLPPVPNLAHLRKQAKALLRELQQRKPATKLSEAQHLVARQYGFASWAKLKAHVASLPPSSPLSPAQDLVRSGLGALRHDEASPTRMFDRYTEAARRVLFFARYEAARLGSPEIEPEHVLLGLVRDNTGLPSRIFARSHLSLERARDEVRMRASRRLELPTSRQIPLSLDARQVLRATAEEADGLRHAEMGAEHMLLGLLRQETSRAGAILVEHGVQLEAVRDEVRYSHGSS